jgi:hypothetical protein
MIVRKSLESIRDERNKNEKKENNEDKGFEKKI